MSFITLFLTSKLGRDLAMGVAAILIFSLVTMFVYQQGRKSVFSEQILAAYKAERLRNDIDVDTEKLSDLNLCIALGGLPNSCAAQLRRLDQTANCAKPRALGASGKADRAISGGN